MTAGFCPLFCVRSEDGHQFMPNVVASLLLIGNIRKSPVSLAFKALVRCIAAALENLNWAGWLLPPLTPVEKPIREGVNYNDCDTQALYG